LMPWMLTKAGFSNVAPDGAIPDTVKYAFYAGGLMLMGTVLWTVLSRREYPPEQLRDFDDAAEPLPIDTSRAWRPGLLLLAVGLLVLLAIRHFALEKELYVLAGGLLAFGALFAWLAFSHSQGMLRQVMGDLYSMPDAMRRLAIVQFGSNDPHSVAYNTGANWVGVLMGAYNGFAALAAIVIPLLVRRIGLR